MVQNMIRKRLANIEKSPNKGMASLVAGIVSARTCENTVRDSRIVTPEINTYKLTTIKWLQYE